MKNLINFIIKILSFIVTFLFIIFILFLLYTFFLSYTNKVSIKDTTQYIATSFSSLITGNNISDNIISNTSQANITIDTYDTNTYSQSLKKNNFYYDQLDNNAKIIYNALKNNITSLKKDNFTIDFSTQFNALLQESTGQYKLNKSFQSALDAFFFDYPELFYIDLTKISLIIKYTSVASKTTYRVSIAPQNSNNYLYDEFESESKVDEAISKIESISNNIVKNINGNNDYNKALQVHDILVNSLEYDSSSQNNSHSIYGAFIDNKVVCEGYSKAFKYLLDKLNINCILVTGIGTNSSGTSESHMWNYIQLDNSWYGVDVTWDDPIIVGGSASRIIRHDYFCNGINNFIPSHNYTGKISDTGMLFTIPTLSKTNYK